ncbi:MAG: helix-turn-helix domain-containing protein [Saprospiraceae bacterium]
MNKLYFALNLKYLLDKNGMTQTFLAEKLGVKNSAVNAYLKSGSYPKVEGLLNICEIFDVSADDLLTKDLRNDINDIRAAVIIGNVKEDQEEYQPKKTDPLDSHESLKKQVYDLIQELEEVKRRLDENNI